jgi:hypothetical protein
MSKDKSARSDMPEEPTAAVNANNLEDADLDAIAGGGLWDSQAIGGAIISIGETGIS